MIIKFEEKSHCLIKSQFLVPNLNEAHCKGKFFKPPKISSNSNSTCFN